MDVDPHSYLQDPTALAARGTLNHLEHGLILAAVQLLEGVARGFLFLLLELIAPELMNRACAQRPLPAAGVPSPEQQVRFVLAPPKPPRFDRVAGLFGETLDPEHWRVSFRFFRVGRQNALEAVSGAYTLRTAEDAHKKLRGTLSAAATVMTAGGMPALPLARRIVAAQRVLADPRGQLARILQRLHKEPDVMMRRPPRIADPATSGTSLPHGYTCEQIMDVAHAWFEADGFEIAASFAKLPNTS